MKISLIWAMDSNRLIGRENALPWKLPADMVWFKQNTMGKPILMGRKTYESIGRPLPGRVNIILSRQADLHIDGCTVVSSLAEARATVPDAEEIMVMGGAEIYALLIDQADYLYITEIDAAFEGDAWFPIFNRDDWQVVSSQSGVVDEKNIYPHRFITLKRKRHSPQSTQSFAE
ncbi:type 3 dihydrofolate reductase [Mariprofundus sp. EBB-1]|uniref:type 3 dihydrofolate reductase n=1 Tax=Mariprofundus sp. EBB-1 TaxID=2650971 RepID=UPI000EF26645|nr:type 3 dihydrofolate reductase [Mariprofundus sp. EBB-1]RLL52681.1 type 3 dihydrofolate reductase [Mariprofundus sp. EBB-1]